MPKFVAILLLGAMTVLSVLDNRSWRLILATVPLCTSLSFFTVGVLINARQTEVFGATAAYTAVLVV